MNSKIIENLLLISAIASLISCQREELSPSQERETVELQFTCAEVLSQEPATPDTKTAWTGKDVIWSKGDRIAVTYRASGNAITFHAICPASSITVTFDGNTYLLKQ